MGRHLFLVCMLAGLVLPASAAGRGWYATPHVKYFDKSGYSAAVDEAAREWSFTGSPLRLIKVNSARKADIIVRSKEKLPPKSDGTEVAGRGGYGVVWLAHQSLRGDAVVRQADVAAHEFGHALGLQHSAGECDVMYHRSATYACDSKGDRYRCGPGPNDVRRLARIWGWKPHVTKTTGYCKYTPPAAELTGDDPAEITVPAGSPRQQQIPFYVRNMSEAPWIIDLLAVPVDPSGSYMDNGCLETDGPFVGSEIENVKNVLPGQVAKFIVFVCADPGQTKTFSFRLASKWISPKPFVFGPVWTVTVHFPAAQSCTNAPPGTPPGYFPSGFTCS